MGVLIDHVNGVLYTNQVFAWASYYSVSLFVLVSGYNTFLSWNREPYGIAKMIKKCNAMIIPYAVAVFIFDIVSDYYFSLQDYLYMLVHFNASGPHYYVLLYLQLVILGPLFASLISSNARSVSIIKYSIVLVVSILISIFTTNHTDLLGVYGGGGRLAGGNYLVLFVIGMIIASEKENIESVGKKSLFCIIILVIAIPCWIHYIYIDRLKLDSTLPFGVGFNPSSVSFGLYAVLLFLLIYYASIFGQGVGRYQLVNQIVKPVLFIGKHTLYIFLYHRLFLDYVNTRAQSRNIFLAAMYENLWFRRVWIFAIMLLGPILIELILKYVKKYIVGVYIGETE